MVKLSIWHQLSSIFTSTKLWDNSDGNIQNWVDGIAPLRISFGMEKKCWLATKLIGLKKSDHQSTFGIAVSKTASQCAVRWGGVEILIEAKFDLLANKIVKKNSILLF
jgi:hypothetical protein